ncbi:MAG: hypothetical protein ACT4PL_00690 [Phycisphaerales bacterium]
MSSTKHNGENERSTSAPTPGEQEVVHEPADALSFEAEMQHGLARHRGRGRRLSESLRAAEEGELTNEQFLFVMAIDAFKRANGVSFPAWSDVLEIIRLLGYRKTCASELALGNAEDWTEKSDTTSNVRPQGFERRIVGPGPSPTGGGKNRKAA